jgi:hypothetical protein
MTASLSFGELLRHIIEHFAAQAGECFCTHRTCLMSAVEVLTRKWALQNTKLEKSLTGEFQAIKVLK